MQTSTLIKSINRFSALHKEKISKIIETQGLYWGQHPILWDLLNNGPETQAELVNQLGVSAPSITNSIKRLSKNGFVTKQTDENDLRKTCIQLTEKGEFAALYCRREFAVLDEIAFHNLSDESREEVNRLFQQMICNLEHME